MEDYVMAQNRVVRLICCYESVFFCLTLFKEAKKDKNLTEHLTILEPKTPSLDNLSNML